MERPCRELQLRHGLAHQGAPGIVQAAELAHFGHAHVGVARRPGPAQAIPLPLAGGLHPLANR